MVPRSSGIILLSLQAWLEEQGPNAWQTVLDALPRAIREDLSNHVITPMKWYPTESALAALHTAAELFGPHGFYDIYGTHAANYALTKLHRFVVRFTSPIWVVSRATRIWKNFHDTGKWTIDEARDGHLRGTLHGFGVVDGRYCEVLTAWLRRMGQVTGAEKIEVKHVRCRSSGHDACTWEGDW